MKEGHNVPSVTNDDCVHENGEAINTKDSPGRQKLRGWLNRNLRIKMTDGRVLMGAFLCTDRDANVILGSCSEFLSEDHTEARTLGLAMIPVLLNYTDACLAVIGSDLVVTATMEGRVLGIAK